MNYYDADTEEELNESIRNMDDSSSSSFFLQHILQHQQQQQQQQQQEQQIRFQNTNMAGVYLSLDSILNDDSSEDSDYSLDYEYLGPRQPIYRDRNDADSDASELSCNDDISEQDPDTMSYNAGFDMWDEDPYSTNDFTWQSNDMRLTHFIKIKQKRLLRTDLIAPWCSSPSFWRKEKGWPRQLRYSSTTTNHDQSANALCLVSTNYACGEQLFGIYRNRIVECGRPWSSPLSPSTQLRMKPMISDASKRSTTWIGSDITTTLPGSSTNTTYTTSLPQQLSASSSTSSDGSKFCSTHISISLRRSSSSSTSSNALLPTTRYESMGDDDDALSTTSTSCISKFVPFTKYLKRSEFTPPPGQQHAYVSLGFEPLCLEKKYGYMAIGGLEGEFELYCCMDKDHPVKIWGTVFKGRDNIMLMTNAIQIVRWKRSLSNADSSHETNTSTNTTDKPLEDDGNNNYADGYDYFLFACMNEAGILVYKLPSHHQCLMNQHQHCGPTSLNSTTTAQLYAHLQSFDHVPINDAKVSPDGTKMVCVGDDGFIFMVNINHHQHSANVAPSFYQSCSKSGDPMDTLSTDNRVVTFSPPVKLKIPASLLQPPSSSTETTRSSSSSSSENIEVEEHAQSFNDTDNGNERDNDIYRSRTPYSSQHVVWNHSSEYFAHTSDTHHRVLVWRASTLDIVYSIDAAGYTYAIKFHPFLDGVLAFTNRYGYFHTVDLNQVFDKTSTTMTDEQGSNSNDCNDTPSKDNSGSVESIFDFGRQTTTYRGHTCNRYCDNNGNNKAANTSSSSSSFTDSNESVYHDHPGHHTHHLTARHEMTMVAFRGEKDRGLRILAKINGIQWSQDGCYLYVATKKRVLAYEFISWSQQHVRSLFGLAGQKIRHLLEKQHERKKHHHQRKRKNKMFVTHNERKKRLGHPWNDVHPSMTTSQHPFDKNEKWFRQWSSVPLHIRQQVLKESDLSTHW
ncbi:uncharacterized protein BX664DRAFT_338040 [Halteromyces radiatus]|uniref:uncharacterized protein n=1 Tax=Halteromyces radiatus TaxID=101107 RepID=UPI0022200DF7|nr:uncharacterized protein BX664DRAFT_338040 [Halteromyces radiatus]KAI8084891.1 hypothetical protein BX664DRAFT_338040 [Halteromyces radiatus]